MGDRDSYMLQTLAACERERDIESPMAASAPDGPAMGAGWLQRWRCPPDPRAAPPGPYTPRERSARAWRPPACSIYSHA